MNQHLKDIWVRFLTSFHGSEVIIWARLQIMAGAIWVGLQGIDMGVWIDDKKLLGYWMLFSASLTEYLRRRRADFNGDSQ